MVTKINLTPAAYEIESVQKGGNVEIMSYWGFAMRIRLIIKLVIAVGWILAIAHYVD